MSIAQRQPIRNAHIHLMAAFASLLTFPVLVTDECVAAGHHDQHRIGRRMRNPHLATPRDLRSPRSTSCQTLPLGPPTTNRTQRGTSLPSKRDCADSVNSGKPTSPPRGGPAGRACHARAMRTDSDMGARPVRDYGRASLCQQLDPVPFWISERGFVVAITCHARPTQDHHPLALKTRDRPVHCRPCAKAECEVCVAKAGRL